MRFASLGSGSSGNALVVQSADTTVMLDCGFGVADVGRRLSRLALQADVLDAIVVTHEHNDHVGGVARVARKHQIPVWMTNGTWRGLEAMFNGVDVKFVEGHAPFAVGDILVEPFPVPHDAREPAQYVFGNGSVRLGVLTDTGESTRHIEKMLSACDGLVLECNHDLKMLQNSNYPPRLRQRISSRVGHLDNAAAATLLSRVASSRLQHVIAAHLSKENNTPDLAREALASVLDCSPDWIGIAFQEDGFVWRELV